MIGAIKICGIRTADAFDCAVQAGASHIGFMLVGRSPRNISTTDAAALASRSIGVIPVAITVDASDDELNNIISILKPGLLQFHGNETAERVAEVRARFAIPVMKVISVTDKASIHSAHHYEHAADWLMFDAASGGSGQNFDWTWLSGEIWQRPWMLAGGLTPDTVANAIYQSHPPGVDVSSGVESSRGIKDCGLIASFISSAKKAFDDIASGKSSSF